MATYAVTGSSGYIGTRTIRGLLDADPENRVLGFDVRPPRISDARLEHTEMDVRDPRLRERLTGRGVDALLHFAFIVDPLYDEHEMTDIDVGGTRNVLEAVAAAGIPYLLATSSTSAYGALRDNPIPLTEEHPTRASRRFVYAHDKKVMDEMLREFAAAHAAVKVCIIRPCIVLGPTVANYIATNLLSLPLAGMIDGHDLPFQYVHEDDLARLVALCVERRAAGIYNAVGSGQVTMRDMARMSGKPALPLPYFLVAGVLWAIRRARLLQFAMPHGLLDFYRWPWIASGDKAHRELGFTPEHDSRDCFATIVARKQEIVDAFRARIAERGKR